MDNKGGIDWQGKGKGSSDDPGGFVPYDIEYERREGQNYLPLPPAKMQKQDKTMMQEQPQPAMSFVDFHVDFWREVSRITVFIFLAWPMIESTI